MHWLFTPSGVNPTPCAFLLPQGPLLHSRLGPTPATSLVHGVARLAAALVAVRPVVAVLRLVAVVVPVCTLILRRAGQEGPGGPRPPTGQPWHRDTELRLGASVAKLPQPPRALLHLPLTPTSETAPSAPQVLHARPQPKGNPTHPTPSAAHRHEDR